LPAYERTKQELLHYFDGEKMGSPKHEAYFDYLNYERYVKEWRDRIDSLAGLTDPEDMEVTRSRIGIGEFKIALLETEIDRKTTTQPRYEKATINIRALLDRLYGAIEDDESAKERELENEQGDRKKQIDQLAKHVLERFEEAGAEIRNELIHRED